FFRGRQRDVDAVELHLLEVVADQVGNRRDDVRGGAHRRLLARVEIVERDRVVLLHLHGAAYAECRRSELPLVRAGGVQDGGVGQQRREQLIVDQPVLERALGAAL